MFFGFIAGLLVGSVLTVCAAVAFFALKPGPTLADHQPKRGSRILRIIDKD